MLPRFVAPVFLLQPWCAMMAQEKMAFKFWEAQGVLNYNCIDTGAPAASNRATAGLQPVI